MRRAVAADVIVLAAAGNCVRTVVWPARYVECIAVAGTNAADGMWRGSCRGSAVDISAPGTERAQGGPTAAASGRGRARATPSPYGGGRRTLARPPRPGRPRRCRAGAGRDAAGHVPPAAAGDRAPTRGLEQLRAGRRDRRRAGPARRRPGRGPRPRDRRRRRTRTRSRASRSPRSSPRPPGRRRPSTPASTGSGSGPSWPRRCCSSSSRNPRMTAARGPRP